MKYGHYYVVELVRLGGGTTRWIFLKEANAKRCLAYLEKLSKEEVAPNWWVEMFRLGSDDHLW